MAVRQFDGSDDFIQVAAPAYFSAEWTWIGILKRNSNGSWLTPFSIGNPSANSSWAINFMDTGGIEWAANRDVSANAQQTSENWADLEWRLFAISNSDTGVNPHRFHYFDDVAWVHANMNSSSNPLSDPHNWTTDSGVLQFGRWNSGFNYFNGKMAMQALNIGTALADGDIEDLAGLTKDDYVAAGFDHLWEFNQASTATTIEDYIGSLDQTAITGTTVVTNDDPPSSIYSLEAAEQQIILPDADLATTGWSTAPLFSKINDDSDATVITATAS